MTRRPPTPDDLRDGPELAALHFLETALDLASSALLPVHPELGAPDYFEEHGIPWSSPALAAARLVQAMGDVARVLDAYHDAVDRERQRRQQEIDQRDF